MIAWGGMPRGRTSGIRGATAVLLVRVAIVLVRTAAVLDGLADRVAPCEGPRVPEVRS